MKNLGIKLPVFDNLKTKIPERIPWIFYMNFTPNFVTFVSLVINSLKLSKIHLLTKNLYNQTGQIFSIFQTVLAYLKKTTVLAENFKIKVNEYIFLAEGNNNSFLDSFHYYYVCSSFQPTLSSCQRSLALATLKVCLCHLSPSYQSFTIWWSWASVIFPCLKKPYYNFICILNVRNIGVEVFLIY